MSELVVTIRDANRSVCGHVHGRVVDKLVAALSADPETIEELQAAVMRFVPPDDSSPIAHFRRGEDDEPYDAGVCIIDLAAQYVAYESSYSSLGRRGRSITSITSARSRRGCRFTLRTTGSSITRLILGGPSPTSAVASGRRSRGSTPVRCSTTALPRLLPSSAWRRGGLSGRTAPGRRRKDGRSSPARAGEARRSALGLRRRGGNPRPLADDASRGPARPHAPRSLACRARPYRVGPAGPRPPMVDVAGVPPGIAVDSAAYRFGGFGTQENTDVLRTRAASHRQSVGTGWFNRRKSLAHAGLFQPDLSCEELIDRLRQLQREWFDVPCEDSMGLVTPGKLIALERERIPYAVSGEAAMVDCECPLCQMMADPISGRRSAISTVATTRPTIPSRSTRRGRSGKRSSGSRRNSAAAVTKEDKLREAGLWRKTIRRPISPPAASGDDLEIQLFGPRERMTRVLCCGSSASAVTSASW